MNFRLSGEVQVSLSSAEPEQGEAALVLRVDPPAQLQGVLAEGGSSSRVTFEVVRLAHLDQVADRLELIVPTRD